MTAVNAVGHALANQRLFQQPRLGVGAIENRDIAAVKAFVDLLFDGIDDIARFLQVVKPGVNRDRLAFDTVSPQVLPIRSLLWLIGVLAASESRWWSDSSALVARYGFAGIPAQSG